MNQHQFEITEDDITNARSDSYSLGEEIIAAVISRTLPDAIHIKIDLATIRWSDSIARKRYTFMTPTKARNFLITFNNKQPFTLRLRAPVHIAEMHKRKAQR